MAKRRRVNKPLPKTTAPPGPSHAPGPSLRFQPWLLSVGLLGLALVYVAYHPSDSISVEKGEALWFCLMAVALATLTFSLRGASTGDSVRTATERGDTEGSPFADQEQASLKTAIPGSAWAGVVLDVVPWCLAAWIMLAAFSSSPPGNLRLATNEAWLWVGGAAVFTSSRRLMQSLRARQAVVLLLIVIAAGLAVHGMHQYYVSLPNNRSDYQQDPERVLQMAGIDAPPGSSERMVFENRLFDGGPTGTYALANSLAAILLLGIIGSTGVLRLSWSSLSGGKRVAWFAVLCLCAYCLVAARSRSAILAALLAAMLILLAESRLRKTRRSTVLKGLVAITAVGLIGGFGLALFGNPEWFEEAPASLAFRFQYWRSTWQMALERPLFGAGPGNFQSIYERYREASATEQIAEPHNFLFETLACGGFVALALLAVLIAAGSYLVGSRWNRAPSESDESPIPMPGQALLWGAAVGLGLVWLIGFVTASEPDFEAHLFAVPVALAVALGLWSSVTRLKSRDVDLICTIMLVALMVHLLVSGGWTVPGIAIVIWILCGLLTRTETGTALPGIKPDGPRFEGSRLRRIGVGMVGLGLMALIYTVSLRPVGTTAAAMSMVEYLHQEQRLGSVKVALDEAMAADPWAIDPALWRADFCRWKLVAEGDTPTLRKDWEESLREVKRRAGDDPAVFRIVGGHQLHVYQRYGQISDLEAAAETFQRAAGWSPANQWLAAQVAVIADARGNDELAGEMAATAKTLSELGGNIERSLDRQQVYVARKLGRPAQLGPVRRPASDLLTNQLTPANVMSPN